MKTLITCAISLVFICCISRNFAIASNQNSGPDIQESCDETLSFMIKSKQEQIEKLTEEYRRQGFSVPKNINDSLNHELMIYKGNPNLSIVLIYYTSVKQPSEYTSSGIRKLVVTGPKNTDVEFKHYCQEEVVTRHCPIGFVFENNAEVQCKGFQ